MKKDEKEGIPVFLKTKIVFLKGHKVFLVSLQKYHLKQKKPDKKSFAFFVKLFLSG
jgi:hypothetical protein